MALITLRGSEDKQAKQVLRRALSAAEAAHSEARPMPHSAFSSSEVCIVVPSALLEATAEALHREFADDLADGKLKRIDLDFSVAVIAVVGENPLGMPALAARVLGSLREEGLRVLADANESSQSTISIVVAREHLKDALVFVHRQTRPPRSTQVLKLLRPLSNPRHLYPVNIISR